MTNYTEKTEACSGLLPFVTPLRVSVTVRYLSKIWSKPAFSDL